MYARFAFSIFVGLCLALPLAARELRRSPARTTLVDDPHGLHLSSSSGPGSFKAGAAADSFCLYGGPGSVAGKFQLADDITPDAQGWISHDATDQPTLWRRHDFNSPTATQCMWAGRTAAEEPGWNAAPGYGNSWDTKLSYRRTVSDPSVAQTVDLSFVFNHDVEPGYDFFRVEYENSSGTQEVYRVSGYNKPSHGSPIFTPLDFPDDVTPNGTISYAGNDYAGDDGDEIVIHLRVTSDGAWSDQDGLWPSDGAAQVDDITVSSSEGVDLDDFEAGNGNWVPSKPPFAGDFGKVFTRAGDLDPCRENTSPVIGFLDDGTPPNNPDYVGPGTGGSLSPNSNYGIPGGWVVNYSGGVSFGQLRLQNEWWSPEIAWDLPGAADDGSDVMGVKLRFSVLRHFPLITGMGWNWAVRSFDAVEGQWSSWRNRSSTNVGGSGEWFNFEQDITDLIEVDRDRIQVKLYLTDWADIFSYPGTDATPAPLYDNVALIKYQVGGPVISARVIDLFADSFAQSGLADVSSQAARDLLDCRLDMARSVASGAAITPGDSIVADIHSVIPGVAISDSLTQITLHYNLSMNPVFEAAIRANAPATTPGGGPSGRDLHAGSVAAYQSTTSAGAPVNGRYAFDLPDQDFMYPGDVLQYYIEAVDDDGRTTTLPADLTGFNDPWSQYDRRFTVRALPSYTNSSGAHPEILWWNDAGHGGGESTATFSIFSGLGLTEGIWVDSYTTKGAAASSVHDGLGSAGAHGATPAQLAGYSCLIYESSDKTQFLIGDGSNDDSVGGSASDKSNDLALLSSWFHDVSADRYIVHFGDNLASYLAAGSVAQQGYLQSVMGVLVNDPDLRDEIDGQTAPHVLPLLQGFNADFVAFGGCLGINQFDSILPSAGAVAAHGFEMLASPGNSYTSNAASVLWDRMDGHGNRKVSVSFPYGFASVHGVLKRNWPARSDLLQEVLDFFGGHDGPDTDTPAAAPSFQLHRNAPNPFNPRTTLHFTLGRAGEGAIRIYNLRGELVRMLHAGHFEAGENRWEWNGRDDGGATVASGIYLARFDVDGFRAEQKLALVK